MVVVKCEVEAKSAEGPTAVSASATRNGSGKPSGRGFDGINTLYLSGRIDCNRWSR
mgnify:CR=1 FL=1